MDLGPMGAILAGLLSVVFLTTVVGAGITWLHGSGRDRDPS